MIPLHYSSLIYIVPALYAQLTPSTQSIATALFILIPFAILNHALQPYTPCQITAVDRIASHVLAGSLAYYFARLPLRNQNPLFWFALIYTAIAYHILKRKATNPTIKRTIHNSIHAISAFGICVAISAFK